MAFSFRNLPVLDEHGATQNFEQLQALLSEGLTEANLAKAVQAKLNPGAWANPTGFSSKLEETATVQVRSEQGATSARLKGLLKTKEAIPGKTALFTVGFHPAEEIVTDFADVSANKRQVLRIKTTGVFEAEAEMTAAHFFSFHGLTYNLT